MNADPHIARRFSSRLIRSASAEAQMVLLSTSSISILSSIVVVSMRKDAHHDPARALLLHPFLRAIRKHNARS